ncbi:hypothetical protein TNCV_959891 [Trichonephila clavipes]|nr:hypothetical protein TNCV_959891 [Trichonephila clavipes]
MPVCVTKVEEIVDLLEPMDRDCNAEIDNEFPIKTVTFSNVLDCLCGNCTNMPLSYAAGWDITRIQICITSLYRKRLRSTLNGVVHKSISRSRFALQQSFEVLSYHRLLRSMEHFTNTELADMRLIYGLAKGNARVAERLYR